MAPSRPGRRLALLAILLVASFCAVSLRSSRAPDGARVLVATDDVAPDHAVELVFGVFGLAALATVYLARVIAERHARLAALAGGAGARVAPTAPGRIVVTGVVEADGDEPPVRVSIEQEGRSSQSKGGTWTTRWTERSRRVEARPFRLRLEDGALVRVDPGRAPWLVDMLDHTEQRGGGVRVRSGALTAGEWCTVSGVARLAPDPDAQPVEAGYRSVSVGTSWLVGAAPGTPLRVATGNLLGVDHEDAASFHRGWGIAFGAVLLFTHVVLAPFHLRALLGTTTRGEVTAMRSYVTQHKGSSRRHDELTVRVDGATKTFTEDVAGADYRRTQVGDALAVVDTPLGRFRQLGARPTVTIAALASVGFVWLVALASYVVSTRERRPWYLKRRLVEDTSGKA